MPSDLKKCCIEEIAYVHRRLSEIRAENSNLRASLERNQEIATAYAHAAEKAEVALIETRRRMEEAETNIRELLHDRNHQTLTGTVAGYSLNDYRCAPAGEGPLAYQWSDTPHRLIYDLVSGCEALLERAEKAEAELAQAQRKWDALKTELDNRPQVADMASSCKNGLCVDYKRTRYLCDFHRAAFKARMGV